MLKVRCFLKPKRRTCDRIDLRRNLRWKYKNIVNIIKLIILLGNMSWDPWEPSLVSPIRMIIIGHPGRFFGMHRLPVPGRLWQVHYTFNLRDFAKIIFGVLLMKKQDARAARD